MYEGQSESGGVHTILSRAESTSIGLLVLGMHRSGTSALAGTLNLLGVFSGSSLSPPHPGVNPKGFWENPDIVRIHDLILAELGSSWHDERNRSHQWRGNDRVTQFRQELELIVRRDLMPSALWMVKDPRMCRLMPFWTDVIANLAFTPKVIIILRHPFEVAKSLQVRDGIPWDRALLLWLQYLIDVENSTRTLSRALVVYDQLLSDWRSVLSRVHRALDVPLLFEDVSVAASVDQFLAPSLRHHITPKIEGGRRITLLAELAYQLCIETRDLLTLQEKLQPIAREVSILAEQLGGWSTEIQMLWRVREQSALERSEFENIANALKRDNERIKKTWSWQITKPLRYIANLPGLLSRR